MPDTDDLGQPLGEGTGDGGSSELDADELSLRGGRWGAIVGLGAFIVLALGAFVVLGGGGDDAGAGHLDLAYETPDGGEVVLADYAGEPLVVNFFASWCPPCRAEMPDFEAVHQAFDGQVRFIGLAINDRLDDAAAIIDETGVTYEWGIDVDARIFEAYEGSVMPTTVLVEGDGTIVDVHAGVLTEAELTERVEGILP